MGRRIRWIPGPVDQEKQPDPFLQIKELLNFYFFGAKYRKRSHKFDKDKFFRLFPSHSPPSPPRPVGSRSSSCLDPIRDSNPSPGRGEEKSRPPESGVAAAARRPHPSGRIQLRIVTSRSAPAAPIARRAAAARRDAAPPHDAASAHSRRSAGPPAGPALLPSTLLLPPACNLLKDKDGFPPVCGEPSKRTQNQVDILKWPITCFQRSHAL